MKMKSIVLMLLLTLPMMSPLFAMNANAYPVTGTPSTSPKIIEWTPTGLAEYATLKWNPEYLKLEVLSPIHTVTTIIVQGKDTYGQNIEAKVVIPTTAVMQSKWIFNDTHTDPPKPVAFAEITGILQQGGEDNTKYAIYTEPEPFEEYLGQFHNSTGFEPGKYDLHGDTRQYLVGQGENKPYTVQDVPVEPSNPDPLKIAVNWEDKEISPPIRVRDLLPQADEFPTGGAGAESTIWFEALDENGNKVITEVHIDPGTKLLGPITGCTYSTVCKVWGGNQGDSYYIFTEPIPERKLFYYYIIIDHITIHPASYDILAYPDEVTLGYYPGVTDITVALRDIDGNLVNAENYGLINGIQQEIIINFFTSGGKIQPSNDVHIDKYKSTVTVNITADTNPRTIKVTADANVPKSTWHDPLNLFTWTEMTFDGINSVLFTGGWPIQMMMCGYTDSTGHKEEMAAPFRQWLPKDLGGPEPTGIKLDGPLYEVMIPLYVGCNLISSPVYPMLGTAQYQLGEGIPMELLFGYTSATDTIEAIWWYNPENTADPWSHYIPAVDGTTAPGKFFRDGVGYWIKAEKACTLELSGVAMENAPFVPAEYRVSHSWNLMGFTSIYPMYTEDYLESLATGPGTYPSQSIASAVGPIWVWNAVYRTWVRNPDMLWPTNGFWMNYKLPDFGYLAP
jgi:hypothetical protein